MGIVIIVGCSTAGKSSALRRFQERFGDTYKLLDTDAQISSAYGNDLYNMYLALAADGDTSAALKFQELEERRLLASLMREPYSCLIAAGPYVPTREPEWGMLLRRLKPTCFYFQMEEEDIHRGLLQRRFRQRKKGLDSLAAFGCWDKDTTMRYDSATGRYVEIPKDEALPLLRAQMQRLSRCYEEACAPHRIYNALNIKNDRQVQADLEDSFAYYLDHPLESAAPAMLKPNELLPLVPRSATALSALMPVDPGKHLRLPDWFADLDWEVGESVRP